MDSKTKEILRHKGRVELVDILAEIVEEYGPPGEELNGGDFVEAVGCVLWEHGLVRTEADPDPDEVVQVTLTEKGKRYTTAPLYIQLFHGRKTQEERMGEWGSTGPLFGPYEWVQFTYGNGLRFGTAEDDEYLTLTKEGLAYYDGVYYGDIDIVTGSIRGVDITKAVPFEDDKSFRPAETPKT